MVLKTDGAPAGRIRAGQTMGGGADMALHFYTGGAGAAHTAEMLREVIRQSMEKPEQRFFVIVPEQATMEMQRRVVKLHPRHAVLNLEVTSLMRLAWRVFEETGFGRESMLEEIGKTFLLEKVVLEQRGRLPGLGRLLTSPAYLAELKSLLSELMLYDVSPDDLLNPEIRGGKLKARLQETVVLYRAFLEKIEGTYLTAEEVPDRFCRAVPESGLLAGSVLAFDGFTGFTPVQYRLLEQMMAAARDMYVTVTTDEKQGIFDSFRQTDLFALSMETARTLVRIAQRQGIPVADEKRFGREEGAEDIRFLEQHLFRSGHEVFPKRAGSIRVWSGSDPRAETEACAAEICRLVREEGLRYRDIAVVSGDPSVYGVCLSEIMEDYEIPCFVDEKRKLLRNPFIEFLRAALETCTDQYSFDSMFRMLKSGMTDFDDEEIWCLENYALGTGLKGKKRWRGPLTRLARDMNPAALPKLEQLRQRVCALVDPLSDALADRRGTVRTRSEALYRFFASLHTEEKLKQREEICRSEGKYALAQEYAQVYPYVCAFLDKLVSVLGEEKISMQDYRALIEAGFAEGKIAVIPPGSDRVLAGDVERTRIPEVKVLFFLGVNEGLIPKAVKSSGLLTETDREQLNRAEIRLKPTARQALYIERFYLYTLLSRPSGRLYLSFSRTSAQGEKLNPSYLIDAVCRLFPDLETEADVKNGPQRMRSARHLLAEGLRETGRRPFPPGLKEMYLFYRETPEYAEYTERLLSAALAKKPADRLGRTAVRRLYGEKLRNSASRLETFFGCAFAHFLQYGLRLKERPEYAFTGLDFGNVMHRALELYGNGLKERKPAESGIPEGELLRMSDAAVAQAVLETGADSALHNSARDEYLITKMKRLMAASAKALTEQLAAGEFVIRDTEEDFRDSGRLEALNVELPGGFSMELTGRIDRIDTYVQGDAAYVKIIDYKTGSTKFDAAKIYHGLQLQLALYMNTASEILKGEGLHPVPAGMFYYRVQDPVLAWKSGESDEELAERRQREMIGSGVVLGDRAVLEKMDRTLFTGGRSKVIPAAVNKDGSFSKSSRVLTEEDFHTVGEYVRRKILQAGEAIMSGNAEISPFRLGTETACDFCPYREICGFDRRVPGFAWRELDKMDEQTAIRRMEETIR